MNQEMNDIDKEEEKVKGEKKGRREQRKRCGNEREEETNVRE